jgi:hypothetical protein
VDYFYLLKEPELRKPLNLSPVQQVKLELYAEWLRKLPVRLMPVGSHAPAYVRRMNTPQWQLKRCTELAEVVASALSPQQKAIFQDSYRRRNLHPVEIHPSSKSITLVFRSGPGSRVSRMTLGWCMMARRWGASKSTNLWGVERKAPPPTLAALLPTFSDISEAILDRDHSVQAVGVRALSTLPVERVDSRRRAAVARFLLDLARSRQLGVIEEEHLMKAIPKVVDASHRRALLELAKGALGIRLSAVVASLSRVSPEDAIQLARSRVESRNAFSSALEGFVMHGSAAEPYLTRLNDVTEGRRFYLVQGALGKVRNAGGKLAKVNASERLKSLRSDDHSVRRNVLEEYEKAPGNLDLDALSAAEKAKLAKLCASRLKTENNLIRERQYGKLLLQVADRSAVPLFEELANGPKDPLRPERLYGLAGLMKFSRDRAVQVSVKLESEEFGMFTIAEAAKLVGRDSVPTLEILRDRFESFVNRRWIERLLRKARRAKPE